MSPHRVLLASLAHVCLLCVLLAPALASAPPAAYLYPAEGVYEMPLSVTPYRHHE
ncbi:hypothetical protein KIPB_012724, partial [Kipferlia bialata]|eukprot:g12724.t1